MKRKICIITGTRAEYGALKPLLDKIKNDSCFSLQLIVTGMHLSTEFGLTVKEIEKDGFHITEKVEMLLSSDTEFAIACSMGLGMIGFAKAYERLKPDILLVLGDRFEMLSAVSSAFPFRIPVAHIHGGEATEGIIDELIRHAITKMSHIHFTATEKYKNRVIQMGEQPENVFCFGAPQLDNICNFNLMNAEELKNELGIPVEKEIGVVTYHPVTLEKSTAEMQITELLEAIKHFKEIYWVFTFPNADTEGRVIIEKLNNFVKDFPERCKAYISLGQLRYLSLLKNASLMVGNSSSGLIEGPSFELPVVNIGDRQRGRIRAKNVIDVLEYRKEALINAIHKALSTNFRRSLKGIKNPFGEGKTSQKIIEKLKTIQLDENLIKKSFYEILR
jgi:UDP-N-acetylglucosamine 2-epimerase (non-hydrolysing)/GDP/UDP-N,N'-diacetylbacillosamine 2-epimerase (hydrolysing)